MGSIKIFVGDEQVHDFDYADIKSVSGSYQWVIAQTAKYKPQVYPFKLTMGNGGTYTFYSRSSADVADASKRSIFGTSTKEDVDLYFELDINPKYSVRRSAVDPSIPRLQIMVGDKSVVDAPVTEIGDTGLSFKPGEATIWVKRINPDQFVDGYDDDAIDTDVTYVFNVSTEDLHIKYDELRNVLEGKSTSAVVFDAGLNPNY